MMKNFLSLFALCITYSVFAGDTTTVRIHDHTDMTWYGNYDEWGVLPSDSLTYRKIYLHYTMGCPSTGCAPYDYTTKIEVRHRTGEIDSSLHTQANFLVNGNILDTAYFSLDTVFAHYWDTITNSIDSMTSTMYQIIRYNNPLFPATPTDTIWAWESNLNNPYFDSFGNLLGYNLISADSMWIVNYNSYYQIFDVIKTYELARVITPYGGNIPASYAFTHTFDITDFVQILQDSVEIRVHYSGWGNGWSATLDFEFIDGVPARNVMSLENIYKGNFNYTNSNDFETNKLYPKKMWIGQNTDQAMVKMTTTGHGFDNNVYAAEFKPINYYLKIDGALTHTQFNWRDDCGENPIYPYYETSSAYTHTWILNRANWCPGLRAFSFDHEITPYITSNDSLEINIDFQTYSWNGTQTPSYIIDCQLFQYENANFTNSAEIIDIIKPSKKDEYGRKNPICGKPLIVIRNYGSTPLTTLEIEYKVVGGTTHTYNWTGSLNFLETEEVELPNLSNWVGSADIFEVTLKNPNGQTDDYLDNNSMRSPFDKVPEYPNTFSLWLTTNAGVVNTLTQVSETTWDFYDALGNTVFTSGNLQSNIQYRDTLTFTNGCYTFVVEDTDEDGLKYGYNSDGNGMIRFREIGAGWLQNFDPNFGTNIIHQFTVGYTQNNSYINLNENWIIFPNPTRDIIFIEGYIEEETNIQLLNNLGKVVMTSDINFQGVISKQIDISHLPMGIYFIHIKNSSEKIIKKVVKL